nr:PAAR domain-containing protein [Enterobacter sp.]
MLIPSNLPMSYEYSASRWGGIIHYAEAAEKRAQRALQAGPEAEPAPEPEPAPVIPAPLSRPREPVDAGFCIVPHLTSPWHYQSSLFVNPPAGAEALYQALNPWQQKKAGSILIVADPLKQDAQQIKVLTQARDRVDAALEPLTSEEASFLYKNRNVIDIFSALTGDYGGLLAGVGQQYFSEIEQILIKIQQSYQNAYITRGALIGEQFYAERRMLFARLDSIFLRMFREKIGLAPYDNIKRALGLSSSSIMHRWDQTGVRDIEGYATYIERSAKLVKLMRNMNRVAIGFSALNGANNIYDACTIGQDCEKTAFTEIGKFAGGVIAPWLLETSITQASIIGCNVALGILSAPLGGSLALTCEIIVAGAMGFAVGKIGESTGEYVGEKAYHFVN